MSKFQLNKIPLVERTGRSIQRRWRHARNNHRIRALAGQVAKLQPFSDCRPVIFFNASTRLSGVSPNAAFSILTAWSLRLAGVPVVHFVCQSGLKPCILGTRAEQPQSKPPCGECIVQSQVLYSCSDVRWLTEQNTVEMQEIEKSLQSLSLQKLTEFTYQDVPLGRLVLSSIRWILRRFHLEDDEKTRWLYRQYILSAWNVFQQFSALLDETKPQAVVVFNGIVYPEALARWTAQQRGLRVVTHEVNYQPFSAFFSHGDATFRALNIPENFELDAQRSALLDQYLEQRFQGNFMMAGVRFWPEMRRLGEDFWQRAEKFHQIVPVFSNVIFDTSQDHANIVFEHMFDWLNHVLEIIRGHPETLFVIRAHPDEARPGKASRESVADWAKQHEIEKIPNVLFVDATEYFSSYELIQRSKFVMIYTSTIGLEATLLGVPVLCAGRAMFNLPHPAVFFEQTPLAYHQKAEAFLAADSVEVPAEFVCNARRYLYFQLYHASLPFSDYLQEDGVWRGYVAFKQFSPQALLAENSPVLKVICDGILEGSPFFMKIPPQ